MTTTGLWDVTAAAPAHAGVSGVLAGIVLAVIALFLSGVGGTKSGPLERNVVPQLLISFLFLVVSAVIWGGLSGYPSVPEMIALGLPAGKAMHVKAAIVAASAVTLLAMGALSFVAAMLELVRSQGSELGHIVRWGLPSLAALAMHQVAVFTQTAASLLWHLPPPSWINNVALLLLAIVFVLGLIFQFELDHGFPRSKKWATVLTGVLAAGAFCSIPIDQTGTIRPTIEWYDHAGGGLLVAGALSFAVYSVLISAVPKAAQTPP